MTIPSRASRIAASTSRPPGAFPSRRAPSPSPAPPPGPGAASGPPPSPASFTPAHPTLPAPADLLAFRTIPEVDISPDGSRVAYVVTWIDTAKDEYRSTIHIAPTEGGAPVEFTRGPTRDSAPRWSHDGTELAFLSDREGGERQLYVMSADRKSV